MSLREHLPSRRASVAFEFETHSLRYVCSYSCFADGRLAEIFLQNHKPGSQSDSNARESAIMASIALQYGAPVDVLRGAVLRNADGSASCPLGAALDLITKNEGAL
jgi:hypothetical protein